MVSYVERTSRNERIKNPYGNHRIATFPLENEVVSGRFGEIAHTVQKEKGQPRIARMTWIKAMPT
jgi:hypothetical protein